MNKKKILRDFTEGSITKHLIAYSVPFMLSNLLQTFYNLMDMVFIGHYVGKAGLSAVAVGGDILNFFTFICIGFGLAGQIMLSQYIGKREYENVGKTVGTFCTFLFSLAVAFTALGLIFTNTFLDILKTPAEAYAQAREYVITCFLGTIFIYGYNMMSSLLRGMGDSRTPLVFVGVATVVNIIFNYIFIAIFNLGALGAALGTVVGQCSAFIGCVVFLYKNRDRLMFTVSMEMFIPDKKILGILMKLGIPNALQLCSVNISGIAVNSFVNRLGVVPSAVNAVASKIGSLAGVVSAGINQAGSAMIGQNFSAGKLDRIHKVIAAAAIVSISFAVLLSILLILFPSGIFGLFNSEPEVLELAPTYVLAGVLTFFTYATRAPFFALANGIGNAPFAFAVGMIDGVVFRIGLAILFGYVLNMGLQGFWLGSALAGFAWLVFGGLYYIRGTWKNRPLAIR